MDKIYSRRRIKIPKINSKIPKEKRIKMLKIIIIMTIAISTMKIILDAILPIFDKLCEKKKKSIATIISNDQATVVMTEHSYDELFTIEKDNAGNISMIRANVIPINAIISDVAIKIQNELNKKGRENIEIPLGSFTGFKLFAGQGPGIKITISTVGNIETDLRSEFIAQGINQTLHRVYLQVDCEVSILTPFHDISQKISNQVLLIENVIVGHIPDTYYNLEGLEGKSDALEMVE